MLSQARRVASARASGLAQIAFWGLTWAAAGLGVGRAASLRALVADWAAARDLSAGKAESPARG